MVEALDESNALASTPAVLSRILALSFCDPGKRVTYMTFCNSLDFHGPKKGEGSRSKIIVLLVISQR